MFIRFDMIHERDRQTDGQTPHADLGRAYASHRAAKTIRISWRKERTGRTESDGRHELP